MRPQGPFTAGVVILLGCLLASPAPAQLPWRWFTAKTPEKTEDKMKERMEGVKEKAEKIDALKKQLEKLGANKDKAMKDGPPKDFEDALMKGDFHKAKEVMTDVGGKFSIDITPGVNWNPFTFMDEQPWIVIFKPGYGPLTPAYHRGAGELP